MDGTELARTEAQEMSSATAPDPSAMVIIVDDDPLVRTALNSLFRSVGFETRLYASGREALAGELPDIVACVVTDVRMPELGGFEFQTALSARSAEIPVIFMTGHGDIPMSVRAMKAGAVDFLSKPFRDQDMLDAVGAAIERARQHRETMRGNIEAKTLYETLTPREREVMDGVVRGLLNKQIAGELGIAEMTVKLHRLSLMRKMGVKRVPDLLRLSDLIKTP